MELFTAIDLFAGAGGLSTGLRKAGFSVVAAVEIDPTSAASYRANHPATPILLNDVRRITGPQLLQRGGLHRGQLTILTGCPPCQGFSTLATKRKGARKEDPRDDLIFEVLRLARSLRPQFVLIENVPGLAQDDRYDRFERGLERAGYNVKWKVLDASDFGVPQRRKRLLVVASRTGPASEDWFSSDCKMATVRGAIGNLPKAGSSGDALHDLPEKRSPEVLERIRSIPCDGGSQRDLPLHLRLRCHVESDGYSDVYGRVSWDDVAPTITSGCHNPSRGRFLHPEEHRALTLRESALLQGFPHDYVFDLSRGKEHVAWQIGNAFPPRFIEAIADNLRSHLSGCQT